MADAIGLAEFVRQIKQELMEPAGDGAATRLLAIEQVELEIQVAVSRAGNAGLNVQVVQLGGTASRADTHTVHLVLQPLLSHEERVKQLQSDPRWSQYVADSVEYTVKGIGSPGDSQRGQ